MLPAPAAMQAARQHLMRCSSCCSVCRGEIPASLPSAPSSSSHRRQRGTGSSGDSGETTSWQHPQNPGGDVPCQDLVLWVCSHKSGNGSRGWEMQLHPSVTQSWDGTHTPPGMLQSLLDAVSLGFLLYFLRLLFYLKILFENCTKGLCHR